MGVIEDRKKKKEAKRLYELAKRDESKKQSLELIQKALEIFPAYSEARGEYVYNKLGGRSIQYNRFKISREELPELRNIVEEGLKEDPTACDLIILKSLFDGIFKKIYYHQENIETLTRAFQTAKKTSFNREILGLGYYRRGESYAQLIEYPQSIPDLEKALSIDSDLDMARTFLVYAIANSTKMTVGLLRKGLQHADYLRKKPNRTIDYLLNYGRLCELSGNYSWARMMYGKYISETLKYLERENMELFDNVVVDFISELPSEKVKKLKLVEIPKFIIYNPKMQKKLLYGAQKKIKELTGKTNHFEIPGYKMSWPDNEFQYPPIFD